MTTCDIKRPSKPTMKHSAPALSVWVSQFNWLNFIGLAMFLAPILFGYGAVHYWLLQHDTQLYYGSLYAQLGLLLMAFRQL
jgi:hypothetical protein